jgi:hypothetical protein
MPFEVGRLRIREIVDSKASFVLRLSRSDTARFLPCLRQPFLRRGAGAKEQSHEHLVRRAST